MKIYLLHIAPEVSRLFESIQEAENAEFVNIEESELIAQVESMDPDNHLIILGPDTTNINELLNKIHHQKRSLPVAVFQPEEALKQLKQSLMFSPFSGKSTTCFSTNTPMDASLKKLIATLQKKRQFQSLLQNTQDSFDQLESYRKQVQVVLGRILQELPIGVFLLNKASTISSVNTFGCELFGRSEKDLIGKSFINLFPISQKVAVERTLEGKVGNEIELPIRGVLKYFNLSSNDIDVDERVVVLNNVTEQKKALKAMEQLTYIAAHDLQEPLRGIQGFTDLLQEEYKEELDVHGSTLVNYIDSAAKRMSDLIQSLFEYSRVGHNSEQGEVDLNSLLDDVLLDLKFKLEACGGQIEVKTPLPTILANRIEIRMLFQNIIGNALKFKTPDTAPIIQIDCKDESINWHFSIQDNGIGIDPKDAESVFVIFKRLNLQSEYPGTGIGLTHCKKIVEAHGGQIWVNKNYGLGSTFHFTIPKSK